MMLLAFDKRSFAPFAFSPIAFAIQALVEEIQAERVNGGGGKGSRQPPRSAPARPQALASRRDVSEDEVRAQWELLELRREAQRPSDARQAQARAAPAAPVAPRETAAAPAKAATAPQPAASPAAAASLADDEAVALLLLLAEA